jgi:hypothetical protein
MEIDLSDYIAGGYFVVKYAHNGLQRSDLLPERLISLSECICQKLNIVWGWNIENYDHKEQAFNFGIPTDKVEAFCEWCAGKDPGALYSLDIAREFIAEFLADTSDVVLVGIAMYKDMVEGFLAANKQKVYFANEGIDKEFIHGVNYVLSEGNRLPTDSNPLGFEVVGYSYNDLGHSWLCSSLDKDMHELFSIRPNQYGLIDSYEDAKKVYDWIAEDEMRGTRSEPEPYYPWLIVQYPLVEGLGDGN